MSWSELRAVAVRGGRAGFALAVLGLAGCGSAPDFGEPSAALLAEVAAVDLDDPVVERTPIVDVHVHTFNARYLPLRGIALGRRDKNPLMTLLSDGAAEALAASIATSARLTPLPDDAGSAAATTTADWGATAAGVGEDSGDFVELEAVARALAIARGDAAARAGEVETPLTRAMRELGLGGGERFLQTLMLEDGKLPERYRQLFGSRVRLLVSHMMDLGPVYAQRPGDGTELLDFERQIRRMQQFQADPAAGLLYFVAYSPYRDHWPDVEPGRALRLVTDAVEHRSAYGVKVYPPSGYRPVGNDIPSEPWSLFSAQPRLQWEARYAGVTSEQLDERLDALLKWCCENQVPVFAHCNTGEFEARAEYGVAMASPRHWAAVLQKYPTLRLCLGHAGGAPYWFGEVDAEYTDWGEEVVRLCTSYPNVFCEVGVHGEIVDARARANFVSRLRELFARETRYPMQKKILYGTDWYMPAGASPMAYMLGYRRALLAVGPEPYRDFFLRNALAFLDAERRLDDARFPIPDSVADRLRGLLAAARD
ncbi:MAG: amidohydrolase family protein [Planctomycetes bacterium]|nr:amidohydrolase family protein [Planctomycetota bacterium]